ncbi:MAG TPA: PQQ-binding-like beta-propeller repeat protein [Phycisphaerales bacterium]|nr:PQQ-binding-like beta-propeller repeat protein [Phycisphaerales bacterium]
MNTVTPARTALALLLLAGSLPSGCNRSTTTATTTTTSGAATTTTKGSASGGADSQRFPVNHDDWSRIGYRLDWVGFPFPGATASSKVSFVKPSEDILVLLQNDSTLALLETGSGRTRWATQLAGPLTKFVSVDRSPGDTNHILVSSESEMFTVSAANGSLLARDRFARVVNTRPIFANTTAVFGTSTGEVMAHVLGRSGIKAWGFMSSGAIEADPVLCGGTMAFVSQRGDVMFFGMGGGLVGRAAIYQGLVNDPVADGDRLFIAGLDRSIWCFNTTGLEEWRVRTDAPLRLQPTAHNGTLWVSIPGGGLTALDTATGKQRWANPNVQGTVIGTRSGRLLVRTENGLVTLNHADGSIVDRTTTPGITNIAVDKFEDGNLYAISSQATVGRFIPR